MSQQRRELKSDELTPFDVELVREKSEDGSASVKIPALGVSMGLSETMAFALALFTAAKEGYYDALEDLEQQLLDKHEPEP